MLRVKLMLLCYDDNPLSVNLKFYQFESLVEVGGLTLSEMNASITGGQIVPGSFSPTNQNASSYSFSILPDVNATEIPIALPEGSANYLGEDTLAVNYRIQIVPEVQQKNDLLHWWWFDEAVANKLGDGIGEENGSLQGNATWSADSIYGTSLSFKDIGDRAELGAVSNNLNGGKFGLSFWFRRTEESFNWSSNLVSNVMVGLGDENGTVLEIGSKGKAIDLFLATEIKTTQISIGSEIRDDHWHFLSLSYDENTSDESELKVFLDGKLLGATGEFGGSLKVQSSDEWILGTASLQNPELGRFIGKIDDFRVYDSEISDSLTSVNL